MIVPDTQPKPTLVDLLRHGEPLGGDRYRGSVDDPLSPLGWQQMRQAVGEFAEWELIITSPLRRCAEFSRELGERWRIPVVVEPRLREMSFGQWEGQTADEILAGDSVSLRKFWRDPLNNPPPGGEHLLTLAARVVVAWEETLLTHEGKHLLLVLHGGVIRMILSHVLRIPLEHLSRLLVPYATVSRIRQDRFGDQHMPRLVFHAGSPV